jgi:hypothetical protein
MPDDGTVTEEKAGDPLNLNIGFNIGLFRHEQFAHLPEFYAASRIHPGHRHCHTYLPWNIGHANVRSTDYQRRDQGPPEWVALAEQWFQAANAVCDEVMVSFQEYNDGGGSDPPPDIPAPTRAEFGEAFQAFLAHNWGFTGFEGISFTPWNEPNNQFKAGNGLGQRLQPDRAAQYYVEMKSRCPGCVIAAGDLASNGNWWTDFDNNGSSWLGQYKAQLEAAGHIPEYFAFHGWHDVNAYLKHDAGDACNDTSCVTRRVLASMSGRWGNVKIFDTEVGVGQGLASQSGDLNPSAQADGAAFLMRISSASTRIWRVYYTRLYDNDWTGRLIDSKGPRPALKVLACRHTSASTPDCPNGP